MAAPMNMKSSFCQLCGKYRHAQFLFKNKSKSALIKRWASLKVKEKQKPQWKPVIGLEIHAQIQAEGKLFSRASSQFGAPVNTQVSYLDSALPGTLPVLNKKCVEAGVKTALALGCTVNKVSRFDRKHYFYADLPAGYQITQQNHALANNGVFTYILYGKREADCVERDVNILQLQLEQDSGKSLHDDQDKKSLIDLNRAGCGLMEIVTAPDFTTGEEAKCFVRDLRYLLITLGVCDGKMSEGSLRVDANISVHEPGQPLGTRSEVKNLNSMNSVKKAIEYEIQRQIVLLSRGVEVVNETRSFDIDTGATVPMRDKEAKQDYRFMPEPNLPPLRLYYSNDLQHKGDGSRSKVIVDDIADKIPILPQRQRKEMMEQYDINLFKAAFIVNEGLGGMYEELVKSRDVKTFTTFMVTEFIAAMLEKDLTFDQCEVKASYIGDLYDWYKADKLSLNNVKKIIRSMLDDFTIDPESYINTEDLWQINDVQYLTDMCRKIISDNPKCVKKYKAGKSRGLDKMMGEARRATSDKCNPRIANQIFKKLMEE